MEVAPEAQGLGDMHFELTHGRWVSRLRFCVWLHYLPQAEGLKYLMMTAASPASPLSQSGLLG